MSRRDFEAALEAILFVTGEPVAADRLLAVFEEAEREEAAAALERLRERYRPDEARGVFLEEVAGGLRIVTAPECHPYLRKFFEAAGANRLSMAALETLAIVAYRQPITGPEIQELRGKNPVAALKTLLERRMLRITGRKEVVGRPFLYATTRDFLMHFGLRDLAELPPLEEFEEAFGAGDESEAALAISAGHEAIGLVSATEAELALGVDDGFEVHAPAGEALAAGDGREEES
ncbi:MAG TPA: SMC-Scp complex subunit ScpB [Thermoanaerobaculia bacterium]|nr:SMC-Scp complex subunit ScpB [Thermoanaerobaculia bacterium]